MTDYDFRWCDFINIEMSFTTFDEFMKKCRTIKEIYQDIGTYQKQFYKWYVYANIHIKSEQQKNDIWEYLNNNDINYYLELLKYKR